MTVPNQPEWDLLRQAGSDPAKPARDRHRRLLCDGLDPRGVVFGRRGCWRQGADVIDDGPAPEPPVDQRRAIIVPARNEAHHIGGLLQDLTAATAIEAADSPGAARRRC
ncbi:MAG: hypothetical protein IPH29_16190 [Candidatus Microthrix sp.]|nr:hypothetical protein [Candidatus Microthrix sp.]